MGFAGKALNPGNALAGFLGMPKDMAGYLVGGPAYYEKKQNDKANAAQKTAQDEALKKAEETKKQAQEAIGRASQKTPDYGAALSANTNTLGSSTILTGPGGVNPAVLPLGRTTLLGGV